MIEPVIEAVEWTLDADDLSEAVTTEIAAAKTLGPGSERMPSSPELAVTGVNTKVSPVDGPDADGGEDSDVFVCRRDVEARAQEARAEAAAAVTLFVYGWHQVQPGPLSWVFPSLRAALDAVKTMRNAVEWCICSGESWDDVDSARACGAVLIEQLG